MARRRKREPHREAAIEHLAHAIHALGHDGMTLRLAREIAANFVDALTAHVLESIETLLDAKLTVKRGGK